MQKLKKHDIIGVLAETKLDSIHSKSIDDGKISSEEFQRVVYEKKLTNKTRNKT